MIASKTIGFDRKIDIEWLDAVAGRVAAGDSELLLQAVLVSHGQGMPLSHLIRHPALFPFDIQVNAAALRKSGCIQLQRQGDQTDFVELGYAARGASAQVA